MLISNARAIHVPGWYDVTVTPPGGPAFDYTVSPDDQAPMAVAIRAYVAAHQPPIAPYVPPAQPAPPTPDEVRAAMPPLTPRQFRLALRRSGVNLDDVAAALAAIEDPLTRDEALIEWEYATTFVRTHPLVLTLGSSFGFTPEQIDSLWTAAETF